MHRCHFSQLWLIRLSLGMRLGIARGHGTSSADSKVAILCYKAKSRVGRLKQLRRLHLNEHTKLDCKTM